MGGSQTQCQKETSVQRIPPGQIERRRSRMTTTTTRHALARKSLLVLDSKRPLKMSSRAARFSLPNAALHLLPVQALLRVLEPSAGSEEPRQKRHRCCSERLEVRRADAELRSLDP